MTRLFCLAILTLTACVGPKFNARLTLGSNGLSVTPSISAGVPGGGTVNYTP